MISNTIISSLAILLLASQASTAWSAPWGGVNCFSPNLSADQLSNCAKTVAGAAKDDDDVKAVVQPTANEIQEKMDKVGASLPLIGGRKLMTAQPSNEKKYLSIAEDLTDILVETEACLDASPKGEWEPCMDGWNSKWKYTGCEDGLVCAKQNDDYAQCVKPDKKRHIVPVSVVECGDMVETDEDTSDEDDKGAKGSGSVETSVETSGAGATGTAMATSGNKSETTTCTGDDCATTTTNPGDDQKSDEETSDPSAPMVEATQEEEVEDESPAPAPEDTDSGSGDSAAKINPNCGGLGNEQCTDGGEPCNDGLVPMKDGGVSIICRKSSASNSDSAKESEPDSDAPMPAGDDEEEEMAPMPSDDGDAPEPADGDGESDGDAPMAADGDAPMAADGDAPVSAEDDEIMADSPSGASAPIEDGRSTTGLGGENCPSEGKWNIKDWNLEEVIGKNFLFFEAQQSGELRANHRVTWRGDSYLHDEHKGKLLNWGWFDAGDHLKLVFPMGWTLSTMAWGIIDGEEMLKKQTFQGVSNLKWAIETLEYGLSFLIDCSYDDGEFVAQIGQKEADHSNFFRAEKDDVTPRSDADGGVFFTLPPNQPGGDLLFQSAAAYAAGAMALKAGEGSEAIRTKAEEKAKSVFKQGEQNPGIYSDVIAESAKTYKSDNWQQYGFLAAAWLYRLTGDNEYKTKADKYMEGASSKQYWFDYSWGSVYFGACAIMWEATGDAKYEKPLAMFADDWVNAREIKHTPKGLAWRLQWGTLRHATGGAGILASFARGLKGQASSLGQSPEEIMAFAEHQVTYALGASGHSWIVGFGCDPPVNPHHRDSALTLDESNNVDAWNNREVNANSLIGALVGGPDDKDKGNDNRNDYILNEVALDYNTALFFGTVQVGR